MEDVHNRLAREFGVNELLPRYYSFIEKIQDPFKLQ